MRALIQRVTRASVAIGGKVHQSIGPGLVILLGVAQGDTDEDAAALASRIPQLRIFEDRDGKMNLSGRDAGAEYLVVSQFTLCADLSRGRRPGFETAAPPDAARRIYERFASEMSRSCPVVKTGVFGAYMVVSLDNDGPVTFLLDTRALSPEKAPAP